MTKFKTTNFNNFFYLKIFLLFVAFLIIGSIFLKAYYLAASSRFDSKYFNLLIVNKNIYLINFKKEENKISVLEIKEREKINYLKNLNSEQAYLRASVYLSLPIDAILIYKKGTGFSNIKDFFSYGSIYQLILNLSHSNDLYYVNGLNEIDLLKIYFSALSVSAFDFKHEIYDPTKDKMGELIFEIFKNNYVINEGTSIEVINMAEIDGLGTNIANMLRNVGFNIVSISSQKEDNSSKIVCRVEQNNATFKSLVKIFNLKGEEIDKPSMADISIYIGKEMGKDLEN